jgi:MraZ protein
VGTDGTTPMFYGAAERTIDDKCRIVVPARFRSDLGRDFVVTRGIGLCVFILPLINWSKYVVELVENRPINDVNGAALTRYFYSEAQMHSICDAQGRICLSTPLRECACIGQNSTVMLVGVLSHIELWSASEWRRQLDHDFSESNIARAYKP